ncbi:DNA-binding protein HU [Minicystis rosea]|nr:DNA-binding protein HU [Minicystis rosea]
MRWFVEISPLGAKAGPSTTLCVEAPQWQPALQKARALRGDNGALSNFSIELLDDGFRAIDPSARLRYIVRRAPDETPVSSGSIPPPEPAEEPLKKRPLSQTVSYSSTGAAIIAAEAEKLAPVVAKGAEPAPAKSAEASKPAAKAEATKPAAEPAKAQNPLMQTVAFSSPGAAAVNEPSLESPKPSIAAKPAAKSATLATPDAAKTAADAKATVASKVEAKAETKPAAKGTDESKSPESVKVSSREENPSESSPLTYREAVFAVAPGTTEADARQVILDRFADVRASLEDARMGKLVNLAVFDHVFQGKPQRRPLVTLTWKDWKGDEPELRYPARDADGARSSSPSSAPASAKPAANGGAKAASAEAAKPAANGSKAEPVGTTLSSAKPVALPKSTPETAVPVVAASPPSSKAADAKPAKVEPAKVEAKAEAVVVMPVKSIGDTPAPDSVAVTRPIPTVASPVTTPAGDDDVPIEMDANEPAKAEAKAEPAKPAAKAEPLKAEPAKPAAKAEPVKAEPAKPAAKAEPVKAEPAKPAAKAEPAKAEPAKSAAKAEPAKAEPAKPAAKAEPAKAEPAKSAAKAEPAKAEPAKPVAKAEPAKAEPAKPAAKADPAKPVVKTEPAKSGAVPATVRTAPAASGPKKRLSGDDLITELFEASADLHFLRDALEGAEFVLTLALEKLPSELGVVSLFDMNKREFVIVRQSGGKSALNARQPERAPLAFQAMRKQRAIVVSDKEGAAKAMDDRFRTIGVEIKSLIVAPVELGGRFLGLIEIANPLDGGAFTEGDGNALTYIGQQFAEFVAQHGVIVDAAAIGAEEAKPSGPQPVQVPRPGPAKKAR